MWPWKFPRGPLDIILGPSLLRTPLSPPWPFSIKSIWWWLDVNYWWSLSLKIISSIEWILLIGSIYTSIIPATHWIGRSITSLLFATWSKSTKFLGKSLIIYCSTSKLSIDIFLTESFSKVPSIIFESICMRVAGSNSKVAPMFCNFSFSYVILFYTYSYICLSLYLKSIPSFPYLLIEILLRAFEIYGAYSSSLSEAIPLNCLRFDWTY